MDGKTKGDGERAKQLLKCLHIHEYIPPYFSHICVRGTKQREQTW